MSERLRRGSIFAGCRLEAVVGRGGMGTVFRATQLARQRRVALKTIAPELAGDNDYRERFQSTAHVAATVHHPNVMPVYESGELGGTLYLIMRWVEGTDLRTLLTTSGRVPPSRAIGLLLPVASALAAAHRRGLVHRDVKPANVLIARSDQQHEDHIYVSDFGISRRSDGESSTRTSMFVGTIDYAAPERIEGGEGDSSSDIYSFGCMLFEVLTGHVPFDRPTDVAKIAAHVNDPIPWARDEVDGIPEQLDAIIGKAMAKHPEDRFGSAGELTVALGHALQELETAKQVGASPRRQPEVTNLGAAAAVTEPAAAVTDAAAPGAAEAERVDDNSRATPRPSRRSRVLWAVPIALLVVAGVLVAILTGGGSHPGKTVAKSTRTTHSAATQIKITGSGLTQGRTIVVPSLPGSVSVGRTNVWISLPERGELVRFNPVTGARRIFSAAGDSPTVIAAGRRALWVAQTVSWTLAQFNGDSGARVAVSKLSGRPGAVALDQQDSSAWVADSSGAISHVALGGAVIGTPAHVDPAATSISWGEGWLWAANGADKGLVQVSPGTSGSSTSYRAGSRPVAVALDQGVWTADSNGHVTRFDPRPGHLRVDADIAVAARLDAIAATDPGPFVWTISNGARALYRVTNTGNPAVAGTIVFGSPPVALAVDAHSVWVATRDGKVTQIQF